MKTHREANRVVTTHNVAETTAFSIKATGKAFKILIDGLYSDKVLAVVRELWSNAYDAHAAVGKSDTPFDCHIPTFYDPVFTVRDYGCGMDHDTIMNLYTQVFGSSKEDTNDQVGKLGLGSKSPFAYVDTFTVTAWDGISQRMYSVFIDENDIPRIAVMGEQPSSEPRGISVSFPVETDDIQQFVDATHKVANGFVVKPTMTGMELDLELRGKVVASGTGWRLFSGSNSGATARQGCVLYPINAHAIGKLSYNEREILELPFEIDFPIGDLEISASRESLGYTDETQRNIAREVVRIIQELTVTFQAELDTKKTYWEAKKYVVDLEQHEWGATVMSNLITRLTWRGKEVEDIRLQSMVIPSDKTFANGGVQTMLVDTSSLQTRHRGRQRALKFGHYAYGRIDPDHTQIVVEDVDAHVSMCPVRLKLWWSTLPASKQRSVLWIKCSLKGSALKRMLVQLGRPPEIFYLADMPKPVHIKGQSTRTKTKMKVFTGSGWDETTVIEEDEHVYVYMERKNILGPEIQGKEDNVTMTGELAIAIKSLVDLGYLNKDQKIIGVPQTHKNVPKRNAETWTCLWDIGAKALAEKFDLDKCLRGICARKAVNSTNKVVNFVRQIYKREMAGKITSPFISTVSPAANVYQQWKALCTLADASADMATTLDLYLVMNDTEEYALDYSKHNIDIVAQFSVLADIYPLLSLNLESWSLWGDKMAACIRYINLVDVDDEDKYSLLRQQLAEDEEEDLAA